MTNVQKLREWISAAEAMVKLHTEDGICVSAQIICPKALAICKKLLDACEKCRIYCDDDIVEVKLQKALTDAVKEIE